MLGVSLETEIRGQVRESRGCKEIINREGREREKEDEKKSKKKKGKRKKRLKRKKKK